MSRPTSEIILGILQHGPRLRRYIEAVVTFEYGKGRAATRNALERLIAEDKIVRTKIGEPGSRQIETTAYSLAALSPDEIGGLRGLVERRALVMPGQILGQMGERYVRNLLGRTKKFRVPHQVSGYVQVGKKRADLVVSLRAPRVPISRLLIEVKNTFEEFSSSARELFEVVRLAIEADAAPVLIAAHLSDKAKQTLSQCGVGWLELKRQLVPTSHQDCSNVRRAVDALRPELLGPTPYEFLHLRRPFQHGLSDSAERDLEILANDNWLDEPASRWEVYFHHIALAMQSGEPWGTVAAEIRSRIETFGPYDEDSLGNAEDEPAVLPEWF